MAYNKNLGKKKLKKRISIGLDVNSQIFVSICVRFYGFYIKPLSQPVPVFF